MAERDRRWYVSLDELKNDLGLTATTHDAKLKRFIERASKFFEQETRRWFIPRTMTKYYDFQDAYTLKLLADLLSVTTFTNGDDSTLVDGTDFYKYPLTGPPYSRLEIKRDDGSVFQWSGTMQRSLTVLGLWGYTEDFDNTGAVLSGAIASTTATTFDVDDGTLIEVGWSLLVDSEQMFVTDVSTNTVTVKRGNNGTTAATHADEATVYVYTPPMDVEQAVASIAQTYHLWRETGGVKSLHIGDYAVTYVDGWPVPLPAYDVIKRYRPKELSF